MGARDLKISGEAAEKLLRLCDGNAALVYIYAREYGAGDSARMARELCRTEREVKEALARLEALGLADDLRRGAEPLPADELPQYTARDMTRGSPEFSAVADEAKRTLGKALSTSDLNTLYGIYDHLGLPAEVIFLLLHYCVEEYRRRYGEGRMPRMKWIENEAYAWFNMELITAERAEAYIAREAARRSRLGEVMEILQIHGRSLTPTERRYVDSWLDMGFEQSAIAVAYDRTVVKTGRLTWKYMDSIIRSWNEKGLRTVEEIMGGDLPKGGETAHVTDDIEHMKRLLERMKNDAP